MSKKHLIFFLLSVGLAVAYAHHDGTSHADGYSYTADASAAEAVVRQRRADVRAAAQTALTTSPLAEATTKPALSAQAKGALRVQMSKLH